MDDDLLAEVKAEAEAAARIELERMQAERRQRAAAERAVEERLTVAREAEIQALIGSERARQQAVAEHRVEMFTPPHGLSIPSTPAPAPFLVAQPPQPTAPLPPSRGSAFYVNVVALPLLCVTAIVLSLVYTQRPVSQPLPVIQPAPVLLQVADAPFADYPEVVRVVAPTPVVKPPKIGRQPPPTVRTKPKPKPKPGPLVIGPIDGDTR